MHKHEADAIAEACNAYESLTSRVAELEGALERLVSEPLRYNGNRIEIDCASHADAMERVKKARAAIAKAQP
jgi:hypothetical protein